jgi:hypothetical protein
MSSKELHGSIPVFTQTAFPEQPELDQLNARRKAYVEAVDRIVDMLKRGVQSALESQRSCP